MIIAPSKVQRVQIIDSETKLPVQGKLPTATVDKEVSFDIRGYDKFDNVKPLEVNQVPLDISTASGKTIPNR